MPFRVSGLMKADVQQALTDQGYTAARAGNLDAAISSRASAADYNATRAAKLDNLDALISSRAAPGAAMELVAAAKTAIWNEAIPGTPTVGSFGERLKNNLDAAITSRASAADYNATRAAKLDNLDALISSRAAPGAEMNLEVSARELIWNTTIPASPGLGSYGERVKINLDIAVSSRADGFYYTPGRASVLDNLDATMSSRAAAANYTAARATKLDNLDATVSSRASPADVDTQLGSRGITTARMAKLDYVGQSTNSGSVTAAGNTAGLTVQLDTSGASGQAKSVVEVRYTGGAAATFYAEGSDDGTTWYQGDTFSESGAVTNKLVGYLNTHRYFRFRSPTTGIDLAFEVRALL